jgi:hypothetical protein
MRRLAIRPGAGSGTGGGWSVRAFAMPLMRPEIARVMAISRNTVKAALASDNPPRYVRGPVQEYLHLLPVLPLDDRRVDHLV